jgi:DNA-directed RNA polymerase specialized sigma24 family protein
MRHDATRYLFPGVFAPVLSLDALCDRQDADGFNSFDIPDHDTPVLDEQLARAEGFAAVDAFVNGLPDRDRVIINRLFWLGHTQTQVAADLGVSKMAISKAVARICALGRRLLAPHRHLAFIH